VKTINNPSLNKKMKTNQLLKSSPALVISLKLLVALVSASFCLQASAATITVSNTTDNDPGSLRQAIATAASGDTINFDAALNGQTLTSGQLVIGTNLTITGPGANLLAINGNAASRVFDITSGIDVTISGLTITNGNNPRYPGGGGIFNDGTLTITNSTLSGNSAYFGGGIYNNYGTTATITNCTLSGNSAGNGGGILNSSTLTIANTILKTGVSGTNIANFGTVTSDGYNLSSDDGGGVLTAAGDQDQHRSTARTVAE
jgi:hypothetical protein